MSEEPQENLPAKKRKWPWIVLAFLLVSQFMVWFGYDVFRSWRAVSLSETAIQLIENEPGEQEVREAWEKSRAAYRILPGDIRVVRVMAKVQSLLAPDQAPPFWKQAVELSGGAKDDRYAYFESLLRVGDLQEAQEQLNWFGEQRPERTDTIYLQARLLLAQQQLLPALEKIEPLLQREDVQKEHHTFFVQATQLSSDWEIQRRGIDHLFILAAGSDEMAHMAATFLASVRGLTNDEYLKAAEQLRRLKKDRSDLLLAFRAELSAGVGRDEVYQGLLEIFAKPLASDQLELGRWLNQRRMYDKTLDLIEENQAIRRQDLFLVRADALALSGQWNALKDLLSRSQVPLDNYIGNVFRMRANFELGDFRRSQSDWDRAILDAGRDPEKLWFLESYVRRLDLWGYREEVLIALSELPLQARNAYTELLTQLQSEGRTADVLKRLEEMHKLFSDDVAIRNDMAYYRLLTGRDPQQALDVAENLIEQNPGFLAPRMTHAFALMELGRSQEALQSLQSINVDWDSVSQRYRLLIACILAANGERVWAERYLGDLERSRLLPEERELIVKKFSTR